MKKLRSLILYTILLLAAFSYGCAAFVVGAGAGAGAMVWQNGKLEDTIAAPLPKVHRAFEQGLKDLNIEVTGSKADNLKGVLDARLANKETVWIRLDSKTPEVTQATVRVGVFGDKETSYRILEAARKHL